LVVAGRTPEELADEFEPTAQSIRNWVSQSQLDAGDRIDGLTRGDRQEMARLRNTLLPNFTRGRGSVQRAASAAMRLLCAKSSEGVSRGFSTG